MSPAQRNVAAVLVGLLLAALAWVLLEDPARSWLLWIGVGLTAWGVVEIYEDVERRD